MNDVICELQGIKVNGAHRCRYWKRARSVGLIGRRRCGRCEHATPIVYSYECCCGAVFDSTDPLCSVSCPETDLDWSSEHDLTCLGSTEDDLSYGTEVCM